MSEDAHERVRKLEFDTTFHFLDKYLPPQAAVLQVGAEQGTYALHFARRGHRVIATDPVAAHVEALSAQASAEGLMSLHLHEDDPTRLRVLSEWDIRGVLCLGPYHTLGARDLRRRCLLECRRVVHHCGIVALSYLTRAAEPFLKDAHITTPEAVEAEVRSCGFEILEHLTTDGLCDTHRESLERLAEEDYPDFLSAHLVHCCQPSYRNLGAHGLVILKKV